MRRNFLQPFVITIAACGKAPPATPPAATPPPTNPAIAVATFDAGPASPADAELPLDAEATPRAVLSERLRAELTPERGNPPPPRPTAPRDLRWRLERTGSTLETAKCTAQQIEPCQKAKPPCKPPKKTTLCVGEDSSFEFAQHRSYPLVVEQKQGSKDCFVVGTDPAEQTYCPDQWAPK